MDATETIRAEFKRYLAAHPRLNVNAWAHAAGVSEGGLRDFIKGRVKTITVNQVEKLAKAIGRHAADFILPATVPVVGRVGAGAEMHPFDDGPNGSGIGEVGAPPGCPADAVAVEVVGESMFPDYWEGDVLLYRRDFPFDRSGCLYRHCVVKVAEGPTLVKRIKPGSAPDRFTLESTNAPPRPDQRIEWAAPIFHHDMSRRKPLG